MVSTFNLSPSRLDILFIYIYIYIYISIIRYFHGFCWAVWHSCRMSYWSMADSRPKGLQFRLGNLRLGELQLLLLIYSTRPCCSSSSYNPAYVPRSRFETAWLIRPILHLVGRWAAQTSRVRVSNRAQPSLTLNPHYNHWPCVRSCLVGGSNKYL